MKLLTTLPAIVEALRNAGATEEMIAAAVKAAGELQTPHLSRVGRPRKHAGGVQKCRCHRGNDRWCAPNSWCIHHAHRWPAAQVQKSDGMRPRVPRAAETARENLRGYSRAPLRCGSVADRARADVAPILALLDQGCDLEADILPTVGGLV